MTNPIQEQTPQIKSPSGERVEMEIFQYSEKLPPCPKQFILSWIIIGHKSATVSPSHHPIQQTELNMGSRPIISRWASVFSKISAAFFYGSFKKLFTDISGSKWIIKKSGLVSRSKARILMYPPLFFAFL